MSLFRMEWVSNYSESLFYDYFTTYSALPLEAESSVVRCQAVTYKGRLICIVHRRVHGRMADAMEIVSDDDLVETVYD